MTDIIVSHRTGVNQSVQRGSLATAGFLLTRDCRPHGFYSPSLRTDAPVRCGVVPSLSIVRLTVRYAAVDRTLKWHPKVNRASCWATLVYIDPITRQGVFDRLTSASGAECSIRFIRSKT